MAESGTYHFWLVPLLASATAPRSGQARQVSLYRLDDLYLTDAELVHVARELGVASVEAGTGPMMT
jgi:hypothetical protein